MYRCVYCILFDQYLTCTFWYSDPGPHQFEVQLVGGSQPGQGRVEIFYSNAWGTVCDSLWDINDAEVVCRELGYIGVIQVYSSAAFGQGVGFVWMSNVRCNGREEHLSDCTFSGWGVTPDCSHAMDAGVWCGSKKFKCLMVNEYDDLACVCHHRYYQQWNNSSGGWFL